MTRPGLAGWSSTERDSPDGTVRFEQRARLPYPVVDLSEQGAITLGEVFWQEVAARPSLGERAGVAE